MHQIITRKFCIVILPHYLCIIKRTINAILFNGFIYLCYRYLVWIRSVLN